MNETKYTRKQYMSNECTHHEYYAQFATPDNVALVVRSIGANKIIASTDEYMNDIPKMLWDRLPHHLSVINGMTSPSNKVCVAKACARVYKETK